MMKLFSFILSIMLITMPFQNLQAAPQKLDGIAAIVDSQPILDSDVKARFNVVRSRIPGGQMTSDIHRQIMNQLIDEALEANYARSLGMKISSGNIDKAILGVAQRMNLNLDGLKQVLSKQGINYSRYRDQIEREILITNIKKEIIHKRISISEQEINDYLSSDTSLSKDKDEVHLRHLIIRSSNPEAAKQKITEIAKNIHSEEDFINQAIANSDGQFAIEGGDLGWRPLNQLPPLFVRAFTGVDSGKLIGPIQSNAGFHLLWLIDKRSPSTTIQQQTKTRHILVRQNELRDMAQTKMLSEDIYQQLQKGANFDQLAKKYSEDEGSTLQGGELGWVSPGTMVPEFEKVMTNTDVGHFSKPFQTKFGWHILEVEGRRKADISEKVLRMKAEQALIAQKKDVVLSNWLAELKADAFIDIKGQ